MKNVDLFDDYLNNHLSAEEKLNFETQLNSDVIFSKAFNEHKLVVDALILKAQKIELKKKLQTIHANEFGNDAKVISINSTFFQRYGKTIAVAASTAAIVMVGSLALLTAQKNNSNQITDLKRDVTELKYSQEGIIEGITDASKNRIKKYAPANIEGTGFALNNKGYFITSWHMVKNADSVFVTNGSLDRASAKLITSNPQLDIAIYKIENCDILKNMAFPFSFKTNTSEIGDKIFTLGYPRRDAVYGEGALSSMRCCRTSVSAVRTS